MRRVQNQFGIIDGSEVVAQQRVAVPDLLQQTAIGQDFSHSGDPYLVVPVVEIAELDFRIGGQFLGFVVAAKGVSLFSFLGVVCAAREKIILWP